MRPFSIRVENKICIKVTFRENAYSACYGELKGTEIPDRPIEEVACRSCLNICQELRIVLLSSVYYVRKALICI